jgi:Choline/ethanolamine kinase
VSCYTAHAPYISRWNTCSHLQPCLYPLCIRLKGARQLKMPNEQQQGRFAAWDLADLEREVAEVHTACEATGSPIVNSHNDLLAGNVMLPLQVEASHQVVCAVV